MAYIAPTTRVTGDLVTAAIWNADIVANEIAINAGAIALTSQAIGDLVIATSATQLGRVADVATGSVLVSGGVATAPAYSASPSITALTYTTSLKSTTALATPGALSATQATEFASTVSGASLMGYGTTNDVSLMNRAGTVVLGVGPNTTAVNIPGTLAVAGTGKVGTTFGVGDATPSASGSGITFPATQSVSSNANTLDDYEEGSWTPVLKFGSTPITLTTAQGIYTKIGQAVFIEMQVVWSVTSGTGAVIIEGLPFTSGSYPTVISLPAGCSAGTLTTTNAIFFNLDASTVVLHLAQQSGDITHAGVAGSGRLFCSGGYIV